MTHMLVAGSKLRDLRGTGEALPSRGRPARVLGCGVEGGGCWLFGLPQLGVVVVLPACDIVRLATAVAGCGLGGYAVV